MKLFIILNLLVMSLLPISSLAVEFTAPEDVGAIPDDAVITKSGLGTKILKAGTGTVNPRPFSKVMVHYTGWTIDGKLFDSSVKRGTPTTFPLNHVIQGWQEGLMLMVEGETRRLWIPQDLAYKGAGSAPKGMLVFDVELLEIKDKIVKFE